MGKFFNKQEGAKMALPAKCAKCGKTAYATEQVPAGAHKFHTKCFKCWSCEAPLAKGNQKEGGDGYPYCAKCYASKFGPKGFRGDTVDGSISVSEHKFDTQSHVKPHGYGANAPAAGGGGGGGAKAFCSGCGTKLTPGAKFCPG